MKNISIFLYSFILFFSCSQNPSDFSNGVFFDVSEDIEHQKLNIDTTAVICGFVADMDILDSLLVVNDFIMQDNAINVYNYRTGEVAERFGFIGKGPGEVINPVKSIFTAANKIQLYEPNLKKMIVYNLSNNERHRLLEYSMLKSKIEGWVLEAVKVNDHFICIGKTGIFEHKRFVVLDTLLNIIYSTGDYPVLIKNQSTSEIQDILYYVCNLALRPDNKRFASGSYIGAVLEIFDISEIEKDIRTVNTIRIYPPIYNRKKDVTWGDDTIIGFEDLYATNNFLYALLNGSRGAKYQYPNSICVFDWDGNPVKQYITDVPLRSFAVDESSKTIFAVTHPNEAHPEFVYFKIK
ncbi:MAG: TolB-like 6-bladed beta-propeller domain-containing protein [Dysgonamonadaceae bacterium]|jgi:hypothetical protein|nr:TolB-like 6-bladed beta-propeller domain-containing protein [Dysgonamonadaceae bacterium]